MRIRISNYVISLAFPGGEDFCFLKDAKTLETTHDPRKAASFNDKWMAFWQARETKKRLKTATVNVAVATTGVSLNAMEWAP